MPRQPEFIVGSVNVAGGRLDGIATVDAITTVTAVTAITDPVSVTGSSVTISNDAATRGTSADRIYDAAGTALTPKYAVINIVAAGAGAVEVVALVASKRIVVLNYVITSTAAVTVTWESGTGGGATAISGPMAFAANGQLPPGYCPVGHVRTVSGERLALNPSAATTLAGYLTYVELT